MKTTSFLLTLLLNGSVLPCFAQSDTTETKPFVINPAAPAQPLVILKSDKRTMEVNPAKGEIFNLETIDTGSITRITILKDDNAIREYGQRGKHGVLIIQLVDNYILSEALYQKIRED